MINFIEYELTNSVRNILNSIYNSKDRHYHNYKHINNMLYTLDKLIENNSEIKDKIDYKIMRIAILFHDIIQATSLNEKYSSEITEIILNGLHYDDFIINKVCRLILVTDYMQLQDSSSMEFDEQLIRDLDLKELSSEWQDYMHNSFLIRQEYPISHEQFKDGRQKFLKHMLSFPKIYSTKYFENMENKARENIKRELDAINS